MTVTLMTMLMCPGTLGWSFITHIFMVPLPARTATGGTWDALHKCCASLAICGLPARASQVSTKTWPDYPKVCQASLPGKASHKIWGFFANSCGSSLPYPAIFNWQRGAKCHSEGKPCGMQHDGVLKQRWGLFEHKMRKHQQGPVLVLGQGTTYAASESENHRPIISRSESGASPRLKQMSMHGQLDRRPDHDVDFDELLCYLATCLQGIRRHLLLVAGGLLFHIWLISWYLTSWQILRPSAP